MQCVWRLQESENVPERRPHFHIAAALRCCGKLPSNTGCRQGWRTVRALGCWLSHLSWLSQQDVTAALSLLPADHWAWHPLRSPALSPPPPYLYPRLALTSKSLQGKNEDQRLGVKEERCRLTISDCGLTSLGSGVLTSVCWVLIILPVWQSDKASL